LPEGIELPEKVVASGLANFAASEDGDLYISGSNVAYNTPG
jgi:hypothetical protein